MNRLWWAQIKAVIRLEFQKTLFARRGLWIYVLAALPVLLYIAFAFAVGNRQHQSERIARRGEKQLTYQDLSSVQTGMKKEEVIARLGKPPVADHWTEERQVDGGSNVKVAREEYQYSDGRSDLHVGIAVGKVDNTKRSSSNARGHATVMCGGVFEYIGPTCR